MELFGGALFSKDIHKTMILGGNDITSNAFQIIENAA